MTSEARERQSSEGDTAHLLLALCDDDASLALRILESIGTSATDVKAAVEALLASRASEGHVPWTEVHVYHVSSLRDWA